MRCMLSVTDEARRRPVRERFFPWSDRTVGCVFRSNPVYERSRDALSRAADALHGSYAASGTILMR